MSKILQTRVQNKHDTAANWEKATNFIPLVGEIIIYDDLHQIKIGDGETTVNNLPFLIGALPEDVWKPFSSTNDGYVNKSPDKNAILFGDNTWGGYDKKEDLNFIINGGQSPASTFVDPM